ncbi:MAG TPA: hypothetical protein VEP68_02700 [Anaeromyxobacteraceae bacterium]|nr:hypothetical protein [Anaeromyxobacteraceae bacterium]
MLCTYRPVKGRERALLRLLRRHWPALRRAGLATARPARLWRARGKRGGVWFCEIFQWRDRRASDEAHRSPEVLAVWGPMEGVLQDLELAVIEPVRRGS